MCWHVDLALLEWKSPGEKDKLWSVIALLEIRKIESKSAKGAQVPPFWCEGESLLIPPQAEAFHENRR